MEYYPIIALSPNKHKIHKGFFPIIVPHQINKKNELVERKLWVTNSLSVNFVIHLLLIFFFNQYHSIQGTKTTKTQVVTECGRINNEQEEESVIWRTVDSD